MNYGLPYQGSKNRIAKRLVDALPPAPVLYDVFCGGCAITHAALLSGKYSRVVANDINGMIPHAFESAINGGFSNEDRWISRDNFQKLYKTDPYVAICFSFGNNLHEYCYARDLEPYKRALHYAIFWQDTGPCLKYLFRWRWKGTALADLRKARYYLDRLIAEQEKALGIEHAESIPEHFGQDMSAMAEDTK